MRRGSAITAGAAVALGAVLLTTTLSSQKVECRVVVRYGGGVDSAVASAATREDAEAQARSTACGTISSGMNDRIACTATPPEDLVCREL